MYLRCGKDKFKINTCTTLSSRFKTFKFYLNKIDYIIKLPHKKIANTYFFCQRVDICFTDKNNKIIALYQNVKSEKIIIKLKAYNIYYLPVNSTSFLNKNDILKEIS